MSKATLSANSETRAAVSELFKKAPVLVEVRFPNCATSADWHLCQEEEQLEEVFERLGAGAELRLQSVWDIPKAKREILLQK
jgi:hypothetical protein